MWHLKQRPFVSTALAYNALFLIICLALSTSLFLEAYPRKLLYLTSYCAALFMAIQIKRKAFVYDARAMAVTVAFFLIGVVRFIWAEIFSQAQFTDITSNYHTAGKILIISSVVAYFFIAWRNCLTKGAAIKGFSILFAGLIVTLGFSVYEHQSTGLRVQLLTDSAGTVSYLMTALSLSALFLGYKAINHVGGKICIFCIIFLLNTLLLILTESRAGVLTLPLLYVVFFFLTHPRLIRFALVPLILMMAAGFILMPHSVWQRLDSIRSEVSSYTTNNDTSIGARFSIWKGGYSSINWTLEGQSPDDRTSKARNYITEHERGNPEAFKNVQYHLHDDILETLSLQGISGGVSIIIFYLVLIIVPIKSRSWAISILPISFVIFGLTDTVLIQSLSVMILCLAVFISYATLNPVPVSIKGDE